MKHGKTKLKTLLSSTYAFLLTLLFFTLFVCIGFGFGVFNNKNVISKLNETNYNTSVYDEMKTKAEEIVKQAGLPVSVLNNVITMERVFVNENDYIHSTLEGKKTEIRTDKLKTGLNNNMNQYFKEQGISQTADVKTVADKVVTKVDQEYQSVLKLRFLNEYVKYKVRFDHLITIVIPVLVVLIGVLCFLLLKMHHHKHRGLRYINYALISSSLLFTLGAIYLLLNRGYKNLNVMPYYYRNFLEAYLKWDIMAFLYIGGMGILISIAMISLTGFLKSRMSNN